MANLPEFRRAAVKAPRLRRYKPRHQRGTRMGAALRLHPYRSGIAVFVAMVVFTAGTSYAQKLAQPGNESVSEKSVEWLRDNHFGSIVDYVENKWYTSHPPRVGGAPRAIAIPRFLPGASVTPPTRVPLVATTTTAAPRLAVVAPPVTVPPPDHLPAPTPVVSPAANPVPGEGEWVPFGSSSSGAPGLYTTQLRPDAVHTSYLVVAVWMDPKVVRFRLHPGIEVPGGTWSTPPAITDPIGDRLLAAFNSGFRMKDAYGGFYADGVERPALVPGAASLVIDKAGVADVVQWGRDRGMGPDVVAVRQNLALIVDHGRIVPQLDDNPGNRWGHTVGNKVFVWRSGVGITADGALVYVGGPSMSAKSLGETLLRVGAVRAMELDINYAWVSFNVYQASHGVVSGTKLLQEMHRPGGRYLGIDSRDFVEVSLRF